MEYKGVIVTFQVDTNTSTTTTAPLLYEISYIFVFHEYQF